MLLRELRFVALLVVALGVVPGVAWAGQQLGGGGGTNGGAATRPVERGEVALKAEAERYEAAGWPVIVDVTMTNVGKGPVTWWCGGPDRYPGAEHFAVRVRYGAESEWHEVEATNGQYVAGSGVTRELKLGESIVVPLAIPVEKSGGVSFTIRPRSWGEDKGVDGYVEVREGRKYVDRVRARAIGGAICGTSPFWRHVAEWYADGVVVDAMLKLVTVDDWPVVAGAADVLARQKRLPEGAAGRMADVVRRWLPRSPEPAWGGLREDVVEAALKTRGEAARRAVLDEMVTARDAATRSVALEGLRTSPGDEGWLRRAREAVVALQRSAPDDVELARQANLAVEWLDARMKR
jgi:hypothetical protein